MSDNSAPQFGDVVEGMKVIVVFWYAPEPRGWLCQMLDEQNRDREQGQRIMRIIRGGRIVRTEVPT